MHGLLKGFRSSIWIYSVQFMIKFVFRGLVCFPLDSVFILSSSGFHLSGSRNLQIRAVEISDRITSCLRETLMLVWWYKG